MATSNSNQLALVSIRDIAQRLAASAYSNAIDLEAVGNIANTIDMLAELVETGDLQPATVTN